MPTIAKRFTIPSKLPPLYKEKVLRKLLPSAKDILSLTLDQQTELLKLRKRVERAIDLDPVKFFDPSAGGQLAFMSRWDFSNDKIVLICAAGNKFGKTVASCIMAIETALGRAVWGTDKRSRPGKTPAVIIHFSEDFDSHKQTILPNIVTWTPKGEITKIHYNNTGHPVEINFKNGSVYRFKTYQQGADSAEGKDWDLVVCDEPPPRDLYTGVFRGLVATGGRMLIAATLLKETWLFDEQASPYVELFTGSIHDNAWISQVNKEAFLASLTPEEREVREFGKPQNLVGLIYKSFCDQPPYVIQQNFELPTNCPYIIGVDPHERKPVYVEWGFVTPQNEIVWFDWAKVGPASPQEIFRVIRAREANIPLPVRICIMDPNRGKAMQIGMTSWETEFIEAGYYVILGKDDLRIGHSKMYEFLMPSPTTGKPKMQWTEQCRGMGGPVFQMLRYGWDDWARGTRIERDKKEKPRQTHKDFPDIHRYVAMEDLEYKRLFYGPKIQSTYGDNFRPYGRV